MSVTIKDVAKRANVAPSTVSRVLHDSPAISDKTKRKVRKIMKELGYHLNENARNLVTKSTKAVGIVMKNSAKESLHDPFFPEAIRGIGAFCHSEGYSLSLTTGESEEAIYEDVVKMVQGRRVDGMIVLYSKKDDKVVPYLLNQQFPFVLIGKPGAELSGITFIDNENVKAGRDLTHFLIRNGHRDIAYLGGNLEYEVVGDRLKGYLEALENANIEITKEYEKLIQLTREEGMKAVDELLSLPKFPTAFVVFDILYAILLLGILSEKNIKVPEQASIVCFNNTEIAQLTSPPLTTMDVHTYQLGYEAAKCVIEIVQNPNIMEKNVRIPTKIVKRASHQSIGISRKPI